MTFPRRLSLALTGVLLCGLGAPPPSGAAESPGIQGEQGTGGAQPSGEETVREAARRYQRGLDLYREGDYALALIEFERAYELIPNYRVLYNIGQVRIQLGRYAQARQALEAYLQQGGDEIKPERRKAVTADLEMLAARTGLLTVTTNESEADVLLDGLPVGQSPLFEPLLVDAGEHTVEVRKAGFYNKVVPVKLAGGETVAVTVELARVPEPSPTPMVVERRVEQRVLAEKPDRNLMWVSWAATGGLALGAGIVGYLGITKANELESRRTDYGVTRKQLEEMRSSARTLFMISDFTGAVAVVMGGLSLYLTLATADRKSTPVGDLGPVRLASLCGYPAGVCARSSW